MDDTSHPRGASLIPEASFLSVAPRMPPSIPGHDASVTIQHESLPWVETPGRTGNSENLKAVELGTACGFAISPVFTEQRLSSPRHRFSPLWLLVWQADFNSELHPFNIAEFTVGRIVCMANP
jgi:hypothetical protein